MRRARTARGRPDGRERYAVPPRPATSPEEAAVRCPHAPACVGCPWVARPYRDQLADKHERLRAALAAVPDLGRYRLVDPSGSPQRFGYRNHAKLVFRGRRGDGDRRQTVLGVYRPGTHSVMPAEGCTVHDRLLQPFLRDLRELVENHEVPPFDERRRSGDLRYALARCSRLTGRIHLTLVSAHGRPAWVPGLMRALRRRHPALESAFLCTNPTPGNVLLSRDIRTLFGPAALRERIGDLVLESRPDAFLQANAAVATNLYRAAARAVNVAPRARLLDLYCGVGGIGLSVLRPGDRLLGIEASPSAVACARANARRAGAHGARFVDGAAEDLTRLATRHDLESPDVVLLNPPRKGLAAEVARNVTRSRPAQILYVSCDPDTLARDLSVFVRHGYRLERAQAFDMLPQTPHVEALAVLSRRDPGPARLNPRR